MTVTLDSAISISEVIAATGGEASLAQNLKITQIVTDSREATNECLFVALDGKNASGNDFIISAKDKGAVTLGTSPLADIRVSDSGTALLSLAHHYKKTHLKRIKKTVAITGSVGKTTTKEFLSKLLSGQHKIHANQGNYNNSVGVPLTVLSAPKDTEILICELGMNALGEISKLSRCVCPDVSAITNVGTAHIGRLGSREKIAEAKLEIIDGMSEGAPLFVPYGEELLKKGFTKTFSTSSTEADIAVLGKETVEIFLQGEKVFESGFALHSYQHRECLAAALALACSVSTPERAFASISKITPSEARERIYKIRNFYVFDDAYNASYESINAALSGLFSLSGYKEKSVLLGDVFELGEFSEEIHMKIGRLLARFSPKRIYLYGKYARFTGIGAESMGIPKTDIQLFDIGEEIALAQKIKEQLRDGEIILVKGSHGAHLEKIVEYINS